MRELIERNGLALKLSQIKTCQLEVLRQREAKKQLLLDLEIGIANAPVDDQKGLKASLSFLSEQFLHRTSKKKSSCAVSNADKLLAFDEKICKMQCAIQRKTASHNNEMQRLKRESSVLKKVSDQIKIALRENVSIPSLHA